MGWTSCSNIQPFWTSLRNKLTNDPSNVNISLISDTHGHLDSRLLRHLEGSDEIWHAGDIGSLDVTDALESIASCRAVYGNIDDHTVRRTWPEHQRFEIEGLRVWMTHIGGRPPKYAKGILPELKKSPPDVFICGHSHVLLVKKDSQWGGLHLNPGAIGRSGFHHQCTMIKFIIDSGHITDLRVIEWPRSQSDRK